VAGTNVAVFYVRSYSKPSFTAFIERAFPRAFLPTAVLMTVLALWVVDGTARSDSTGSQQTLRRPRPGKFRPMQSGYNAASRSAERRSTAPAGDLPGRPKH